MTRYFLNIYAESLLIFLRRVSALVLMLLVIAITTHLPAATTFLGTICHQIPERSFWLFSSPLPLCTRCLGIYIGLLLGQSRLMKKIFNPWFFSCFVFIELMGKFIGHDSADNVRFVSGLFMGTLSIYFIALFAQRSSMPLPASSSANNKIAVPEN
jgi:uncharacterized membrane protein